jgi:hypothetical protein
MSVESYWPQDAQSARAVVRYLNSKFDKESFVSLCMFDYMARIGAPFRKGKLDKGCSPKVMLSALQGTLPSHTYERISKHHALEALNKDENAVSRIAKNLWERSECSHVTSAVSSWLERDDAYEVEPELYAAVTSRVHESGRAFSGDCAIGYPDAEEPKTVDELIASSVTDMLGGEYHAYTGALRRRIRERLRVGASDEEMLAAVRAMSRDMDRVSAAEELIRALHEPDTRLRLCYGSHEETVYSHPDDPRFLASFPVDVIQGWIAIQADVGECGDDVFHEMQALRASTDPDRDEMMRYIVTELDDYARETFLGNRTRWCDEGSEYDPWEGASPDDSDESFSNTEVMQFYSVEYPVKGHLISAGELVVDTDLWGPVWCRQAYGQAVYCDGWAHSAVRELTRDPDNREDIYRLLY